MSLDHHELGTHVVLTPDQAVRSALGSVRAEGLEPDAFGMSLLDAVSAGTLTTDQAVDRAIAHYSA